MLHSDAQLIAAALRGDHAAFDALTLRYLKPVYQVALYYAKQVQDAEDITQDAFVKVLQKLNTFETAKSFKPWVLQIARHQALDWLKKKKPLLASSVEMENATHLFESIPDPSPTPNEQLMHDELQRALHQELKHLPQHDQKILFLRYMKGLTFREIAEDVGELLDTVKSQHLRSLAKLKKLLAKSSFFASLNQK